MYLNFFLVKIAYRWTVCRVLKKRMFVVMLLTFRIILVVNIKM
jgi:hypothetical protein